VHLDHDHRAIGLRHVELLGARGVEQDPDRLSDGKTPAEEFPGGAIGEGDRAPAVEYDDAVLAGVEHLLQIPVVLVGLSKVDCAHRGPAKRIAEAIPALLLDESVLRAELDAPGGRSRRREMRCRR